MADFIEIKTDNAFSEAFDILYELDDRLERDRFISAMHHELSHNSRLFAVRDSGKLVAVAAVWLLITGRFEKILWINAFVTTAKQRSQGFGSLLLSGLHGIAAEQGCSEIRVHAHRPKAIEFWRQKAGFDDFSSVLRRPVNP